MSVTTLESLDEIGMHVGCFSQASLAVLTHLLLLQAELKGGVLTVVLRIGLLLVQREGPSVDSFNALRALQDLFHLVFNHRNESLVSSEAGDQLLFISLELYPLLEDAGKCRDSPGVRGVSLLQANSTLKSEHELGIYIKLS